MQCLYVLYDERCGLCRLCKRWIRDQPAYLRFIFVAAGSEEAVRLFPSLARVADSPEELVVISDEGGVYRGDSAWIMCLYGLMEYREWSLRLASPALRPLARQSFAMVSRHRDRISWWLGLTDHQAAEALRGVNVPACTLSQLALGLHGNELVGTGAKPRDP